MIGVTSDLICTNLAYLFDMKQAHKYLCSSDTYVIVLFQLPTSSHARAVTPISTSAP